MPSMILSGGRVVDPATGFDGIADVVIHDGLISAVERDVPDDGMTVVDVSGHAVAPGFIDLHSHAMTLAGQRLQACDGVTTALELEVGAWPVSAAYRQFEQAGAPINYGFSASWALTRMDTFARLDVTGQAFAFLRNVGNPAWQRMISKDEQIALIDALAGAIGEGAIGVGIVPGYAPRISIEEYRAVAELASQHGVPTFTHARELAEIAPDGVIDGAEEIVRAASDTGAHMHFCHVNSTSLRHVGRVLDLIVAARKQGATVTTEAYPYGAGSTGIGAFFLEPDRLPQQGLVPSRIRYMPTGERVENAHRLRELRIADPGGLAIVEYLDEDDPQERAVLHRALLFDDACVASDALPLTWMRLPPADDAWPVPPYAVTHPRSVGTFARSLRVLTREHGIPLMEALRRMTLLPAQVLERAVPAMRRKGRISVGADADITVLDPLLVTDQATYDDSTRPSTGIVHVLVNGDFVVRDAQLEPDARPGRPIRRGALR